MDKISVIVPVYNVEKYLEKCVHSLIAQTYTDLEIILVDDGATDSSGKMCDEFVKKDKRIKVIHKKNGGLSDARNAGFHASTGEYIVFVDSDDYVAPEMMEYMYDNLVKTGADFSTCGVYDVYGDHIVAQQEEAVEVISGEEAFSYILQGTKIKGAIWNKMMKRPIIEGLQFPVGKTYEDVFFTCDLMQKAKKVCVGTRPEIYYVHRENSITTRPYSKKDYDIIEGYAKTYRLVMEQFPSLKKQAEFRVFWSWFIVFDKLISQNDYKGYTEYKELIKKLRKNMSKIIKNPYFQKSRKMAAILLMFHVKLYRNVMLWNQKRNLQLKK